MKFIGSFISVLFACCENLAAIPNACAGNRGTAKDVVKAFIICEDDIEAIPAATNHVISTDITLAAGKTWFQIDIDKVGSSYNFQTQGEGQSKEYLNTVVLFVAGIAPAVTNALNSLVRGNANFIVQDKNGNKFLIGALGDGADVAIQAQNDRNGYIMTITYASPNMPYFYTGAITLA